MVACIGSEDTTVLRASCLEVGGQRADGPVCYN